MGTSYLLVGQHIFIPGEKLAAARTAITEYQHDAYNRFLRARFSSYTPLPPSALAATSPQEFFRQLCGHFGTWCFQIKNNDLVGIEIIDAMKNHDYLDWLPYLAPFMPDGCYVRMGTEDMELWQYLVWKGKMYKSPPLWPENLEDTMRANKQAMHEREF